MLQQTSGQIENQASAAIQATGSSTDAFNNAPIDTVIDNQLHHQFSNNIGSTLISGVVILLTFMAIYFIFRNKSYTPKQKLRYRFRLIYIAIFCYLILYKYPY